MDVDPADSRASVHKGWEVERLTGSAGALHGRALPEPAGRLVSVLEVDRPALVLGSTQPEAHVDAGALATAGVELVRRRSGGGAVLVVPGGSLWVDVVVPRGDPLWEDDVGRSFLWLGDAWARALSHLGVEAEVHRGALVETTWSRLVCFAGLGPGEVTVGGRKVVGISQRRNRGAARLQCVVSRRWDPEPTLGLLALDDLRRAEALTPLASVASGVDLAPEEVVAALLDALP